ncbi:MAG: FKBP-type peptidyl-prolyl cis-trans isomerase [Myxococcota bacterium]
MGQIMVEDVIKGDGNEADFWRTIRVHYAMFRANGDVIDETGDVPFTFSLTPDHLSWMADLVGMRAGGTRRLFIPADRPRITITDHSPLYDEDLIVEAHLVAVDKEPIRMIAHDGLLGQGDAVQWGDVVSVHYTFAPMRTQRTRIVPGPISPNPSSIASQTHETQSTETRSTETRSTETRSTMDGDPPFVLVGAGQLPVGLDEAIIGMKAGGQRRVRLSPAVTGGPAIFAWLCVLSRRAADFILA